MRHLVFAVAAGLVLANEASADQVVRMAPIPDWVTPQAMPAPGPVTTDEASATLLQDNQTRYRPEAVDFYTDYVDQVRSAAGLQEEGSVTIEWRPDTDSMTIHAIEIIRNGKVAHRISKPSEITVLRREKRLEEASLDGTLTGSVQLEDLRVGDLVHVSYTLTTADPVMKGKLTGGFRLARPGVVGRGFFRALWPSSSPMRTASTAGLEGKVSRLDNGQMQFLAQGEQMLAPTPPAKAPDRFGRTASVEFSDFASFKDVSALFYPLYDKAATLAPDSPLRAEIEKIKAASPRPDERALAALKFVQDNIRYLYVGLNNGGYVPAAADLTWSRKYGDCKGKTALLLALLRGLGVDAEPFLVDSDGGDGLDERLPSPQLFDHVIIHARIDGRDYWLDGTRLGDYALERPQFNARFGLPLRPEGAELQQPADTPLASPDFESEAEFDTRVGIDKPALARLVHTFRGDSGIEKGLEFASSSPPDLDRRLRAYWLKEVKWLHPDKVSFNYDPKTGVTALVANGTADLSWAKGDSGVDLVLGDSELGWNTSYAREPGPNPDAPYAVNYPLNRRWRVKVLLPNDGVGFEVFNAADVDQNLAGFHLARKTVIKGDEVSVDAVEVAVQREFPASEAPKAEKALRDLTQFDVFVRQRKGDLDADLLTALRVKIKDAATKITENDIKGAGAELAGVTKRPVFARLSPREQGSAHLILAVVAMSENNYPAVRSALEAALATHAVDPQARLIQTEAAWQHGDLDLAARTVAERLRAHDSVHPTSDEAMRQLISESRGEGRIALLEAIDETKWKPADPFDSIDDIRVKLAVHYFDKGQADKAARLISEMEDPDEVLKFRVDKRFEAMVQANPAAFDLTAVAKRRVQRLEAQAKANPDRVTGVLALARAYAKVNRLEDALNRLNAAIDRAHASEKPVFEDQSKLLPWVMEVRAQTLVKMGKQEEALTAYERASRMTSEHGADIGLILNLGQVLVDMGKPAQALDVVADVDIRLLSARGRGVWKSVETCANAALARKDATAKALDYLKAHAEELRSSYRDSLLCAGDLDGAARVLVEQLANADERDDALVHLQDYPARGYGLQWRQTMLERLLQVRERPEVRAAIAKVGHVEQVPLY